MKVKIGAQVQLRGTRLVTGMRVTFRWPRGALATRAEALERRLGRARSRGHRAGPRDVTVRDRAGRRSSAVKVGVPPRARAAQPARRSARAAARGVPGQRHVDLGPAASSEGGDPPRSRPARAPPACRTVFVKSSDGAADAGRSSTRASSRALHAHGLRVCAWQFVYGNDPEGEARLGADAVGRRRRLPRHRRRDPATRASTRRRSSYIAALRSSVGPAYPVGLTSFPYVDYHARLPYSVFLGPGGAQANLPQVYWKDIGGTVDAVSAHTLAHNRIYGVPIAPLGQTYGSVPAGRRAALPAGLVGLRRGRPVVVELAGDARGDVEHAGRRSGRRRSRCPIPGWPTLGKGAKGDLVVWLQQHLVSADPSVPVDGSLGAADPHGAAQLPARARHPADRHDRRRDVGGRPGPSDGREGLDGAVKPPPGRWRILPADASAAGDVAAQERQVRRAEAGDRVQRADPRRAHDRARSPPACAGGPARR